jgi:hypothetical protein
MPDRERFCERRAAVLFCIQLDEIAVGIRNLSKDVARAGFAPFDPSAACRLDCLDCRIQLRPVFQPKPEVTHTSGLPGKLVLGRVGVQCDRVGSQRGAASLLEVALRVDAAKAMAGRTASRRCPSRCPCVRGDRRSGKESPETGDLNCLRRSDERACAEDRLREFGVRHARLGGDEAGFDVA